MKVKFKDELVTLRGKQLQKGEKAPLFKAVNKDLSVFNLSDYIGEIIVLTSFPSIDTSVCAMQTAQFNKEASQYDNVKIVTVSKDLPFALSRHCAANNINNAITVSDYRFNDFGNKYGLIIDELNLLARTTYVIDKNGVIQYVEICENIGDEPNYTEVMKVVKELL